MLKRQFLFHVSLVFPCIGGSKKNLPSSSLDLRPVNSLSRRALQQKWGQYRQDFRDDDHLKRILSHCSVR